MRILHVTPTVSRRTGGVADFVIGAARAVNELGHEAIVWTTDMERPAFSPDRDRRVRLEDLPPNVRSIPMRMFEAGRPLRIAYARGLAAAAAADLPSFDVLHVHSLFLYPQLVATWEARRRDTPYVVSIHGALDPYIRRRGRLRKFVVDLVAQRRMLANAGTLHVTTEAEAELIADVAPATPRTVVPAGIDAAFFTGDDDDRATRFRAQWLRGHAGPLVLNVGRIAEKKGLDVLIHAFSLVTARAPGARLVIAGPDDEALAPRLKTLASGLGLGDAVTFTGMLDRGEMAGALRAASVWTLPSRTENFGIAVAEAMAAGLPVVISPQVNIAEEASEAGAAVVAEGAAGPFAEAILSLLGDESRRRELGERARRFARRYEWSAIAPRLLEMYQQVRASS